MNDGRRYWWDPDDNVRRLFTVSTQGNFEAKETRFLRSILQPGDVVLDIGANFGWYTLLFSQTVGESGRVHAFEPIPRNYEILRENCELNQAPNVVLNNLAVGAESGERDLYLPDTGASGAFQLHPYRKGYETFRCRVQALDEYVQQHGIDHIGLIKVDIEGAEFEMLHGATKVLEMKPEPLWLLEVQAKSCQLFGHTPRAVFNLMHRLGYAPYFISPAGGLQAMSNLDGPLPDHNFLFATASRVADLGQGDLV